MVRTVAYRSKYKAKKVTVNGDTFDSQKEYRRFCELRLLERAGQIQNLQRQVKYILIPAQRQFSNEIYTKGKKKGCFKPGKLLESEVSYYADFVYMQDGKQIVEDVKGYKKGAAYSIFVIKRKLMLYEHGIRIKET